MSNNNQTPILELKGIQKTFKNDIFKKNKVAVDNLSCYFPKGTCTGFLGANGAGKTTSIKIILGLIFSDRGEILFNGEKISRSHRSKIGYMPEINKLPKNLTCYEVLSSQIAIMNAEEEGKTREELIAAKLNQVGLTQHKKHKISQLSKGLARRLAWAQASIHNPELLILDEPFSGLDPIGRSEMLDWIMESKNKGSSIVLCTHELWAVNVLCQNVNILHGGKLVYSTLKEKIDEENEGEYFLKASGTDENLLQTIKEEASLGDWSQLRQNGWLSELTFADYKTAAHWVEAINARGHVIVKFDSQGPLNENKLLPYLKGEKVQ